MPPGVAASVSPCLDLLRVVQVDGQFDEGADGFDELHRFLDGRGIILSL